VDAVLPSNRQFSTVRVEALLELFIPPPHEALLFLNVQLKTPSATGRVLDIPPPGLDGLEPFCMQNPSMTTVPAEPEMEKQRVSPCPSTNTVLAVKSLWER
jgi:hypothetical protein